MITMIPLSAIIASKIKTLQIQQMKHKDERVKLMNEILSGIKVLKLYAWETSFEEQIQKIREKEMKVIKHIAYFSTVTWVISFTGPYLVWIIVDFISFL